jgi:3-carboxy-cis,cis-muconate cycloisomerase
MVQEHERGAGGWHAEGPTIAAVVEGTGAALAAVSEAIDTLSVDPARMRANIASTRGVIFAERAMTLLAPAMGREAAGRIVSSAIEAARHRGRDFVEVISEDERVRRVLSVVELSRLGDPEGYLGAAEPLRRRLIGDSK